MENLAENVESLLDIERPPNWQTTRILRDSLTVLQAEAAENNQWADLGTRIESWLQTAGTDLESQTDPDRPAGD